ncbi:MAG TPA: penicillin-binding protein 2 [Firmicutes bacterium]|nr:penicillin-binding protein 2 [Bacillota bacterium]
MQKQLITVFFCFTLLFSLLSMRIYALTEDDRLVQAAQNQSRYTLTVQESRGQIYDCHLRPLVNRKEVFQGIVYPVAEGSGGLVDFLVREADSPGGVSREGILQQMESGRPFAIRLKHPSKAFPGLDVYQTYERYQDRQTAAHVIGYTNADGQGVTGIEAAYDDLLKRQTVSSQLAFTVDATGRYIKGVEAEPLGQTEATGGVVLTLDSRIQDICERAGAQYIESGAIVVLDAKTSAIRAMASFPSYSPNALEESIADTQTAPMINRALYAFSPGSIFKIVTTAAALEAGIPADFSYTCTGSVDIDGVVFHCHYRDGHGTLSMKEAFTVSCNPYFIVLAEKIGKEKLLQTASDMGLGKSIFLADGIVGAAGSLPSADALPNPGDLANISFGQGLLTMTPLQAAQMTACIVQGGKTQTPWLVEGTTEDGIQVDAAERPPAPVAAIHPETAAQIRAFMVSALEDQANQEGLPTVTTAGAKTGTAQTGRYNENGEEINQAWIVGFFPAENPEYVAAVLCEGGESGNLSAGPVFREIADSVMRGQETQPSEGDA